MGKFRLFLTELSARNTSVVSFSNDNLSKYQSILPNSVCAFLLQIFSLGCKWANVVNF